MLQINKNVIVISPATKLDIIISPKHVFHESTKWSEFTFFPLFDFPKLEVPNQEVRVVFEYSK